MEISTNKQVNVFIFIFFPKFSSLPSRPIKASQNKTKQNNKQEHSSRFSENKLRWSFLEPVQIPRVQRQRETF